MKPIPRHRWESFARWCHLGAKAGRFLALLAPSATLTKRKDETGLTQPTSMKGTRKGVSSLVHSAKTWCVGLESVTRSDTVTAVVCAQISATLWNAPLLLSVVFSVTGCHGIFTVMIKLRWTNVSTVTWPCCLQPCHLFFNSGRFSVKQRL